MVDDSGATPLPRRVPGASGSPNPPGRVDRSAIPEDLRQRVLAAIATELEHDSAAAEHHRAQARAGAAALGADVPAPIGLDAIADHPAALPRQPDVTAAVEPPAPIRRGYLPPALLGRRLDTEAMTEPLPRIGGFRPGRPPDGTGTPDGLAAATAPDAPLAVQGTGETAPETAAPETAAPETASAASGKVPPPAARRPRRPGRPYRLAGLLLAVVLVAVGIILLMVSGGGPKPRHHTGLGAASGSGAALRDGAVTWVAAQVSRTAVVACDPVTCQALRSHGVPASSLYSLGPQTASPLRSQIIVATAAVRARFGTRLGSVYAPAVLASFGSGPDQVDIRATAPHGAASYLASLSADVASRRASGLQLLHSHRIDAAPAARRQLAAGQVDARLLIALAEMATAHPMYIAGFGPLPPGAAPGIPLRQVDLSEDALAHHHPGRKISAGYLRSMLAFLHAQRGRFRPASVRTVRLAGGAAVLRVVFSAPSPMGLLGSYQALR